MAQLVLVAARARNGVIGAAGKLPWRHRTDMKRFKALTLNKPVLMGRKTWESLKGALPQRDNLVLTRDARLLARNAWSFASLDAALACALGLAAARGTDQVCVIGGGEIYRATLPYADAVELTEIDCAPVGDATFPELDPADWRLASETASPAGEGCEFAARFLTFRRNRQA